MPDQIVEITRPGYWLAKKYGFLEVKSQGELVGKISLDDILAVIISVPGCSISSVLIDHLCKNNIPLVVCGDNYLPASLTLPIQGQGRQFKVMLAQVAISEPRRKRSWQKIIKAKIRNQAKVLEMVDSDHKELIRLVDKVKSGDTDNCESQAARIYWQRLFGSNFRRVADMPGTNSALNYTYAIVRACVARGIVSAGLHPTFSIHHKGPQNPLNLVDDLIEPFRPIADYWVWHRGGYPEALTARDKEELVAITSLSIPIGKETTPLSLMAVKTSRSFADYCLGETDELVLPTLPKNLIAIMS